MTVRPQPARGRAIILPLVESRAKSSAASPRDWKSQTRLQLRLNWNVLQLTLSYYLLLFFAAFLPGRHTILPLSLIANGLHGHARIMHAIPLIENQP
jgi:hypothetical protein